MSLKWMHCILEHLKKPLSLALFVFVKVPRRMIHRSVKKNVKSRSKCGVVIVGGNRDSQLDRFQSSDPALGGSDEPIGGFDPCLHSGKRRVAALAREYAFLEQLAKRVLKTLDSA